jgi:hypothetical protein
VVSVEVNRPLSTPPVPILSVVAVGTPVTWLTSEVRAVPVGPLLASATVPLPEFSLTRTIAMTTMTTRKIDPPAM